MCVSSVATGAIAVAGAREANCHVRVSLQTISPSEGYFPTSVHGPKNMSRLRDHISSTVCLTGSISSVLLVPWGGVRLWPLFDLLYQPWMMLSVEQSVEELAGETEVLGESLPQCQFVHHKSQRPTA
jgi:hypothetical protein